MPEIQVITGPLSALGESPLWDVDEQRLYWVDNAEGMVFRCTPDGRELSVWRFPRRLTSIALRAGGGLVATSGTCLYLFDLATAETELLFDTEPGPGFGFNDGKVDRQGRFVTGLVDLALIEPGASELVDKIETRGALYRLDPDRTVVPLVDGVGVTNGPCFSPDGGTFYCGDSWARRIYAFDYDVVAGTASNRRIVATFEGDGAVPDGATVDEEGFVWVAAFDGRELRRYAPDGTLDRRVAMPVASPTSVMFGGPDLDVLFVTSRGRAEVPGRAAQPSPLGGCVFAIHGLDVRGVPETRFAG